MFAVEIDGAVVAEDVMAKEFVCNLARCKGACCVHGDAGAPLEEEETRILEKEFENIKPFLRPEGIRAIEEQGTWLKDPRDGDPVTPLVEGKECAYVVFDADGIAKCGIELAWKAGATTFQKPISCHLYPIRITKYKTFEAVNYHRWEICSPACELGAQLKVPVYVFLKSAIIRKYGKEWYQKLDEAAKQLENERF
ncbi:hypothetical protein JCM31826_07650 [Thermaurantimonas aggregans]|uniref:DUF3109 domain-containing protein n=1 Tax=Thermaurantimonas aggregans TaxID=2173829 RepID=A0A401XJW4_9FLAO|nr:DUF3109 family protein [Thermaurantimonas aggregans]MCX8148902.1 DUF3109 family protein [Thermaurantimonas aggregans]GCD77283.1 hypothetical protein JCM31826_07650 [Thermaurantimonas aggregans]